MRPTVMRRLSVLPAGYFSVGDGGPFETLRWKSLLAELRAHYRFVLIDAPSLLYPEVAPLAAFCDGTYLVVRLGSTSRRALGEVAQCIRQCQGSLRGCVVVD